MAAASIRRSSAALLLVLAACTTTPPPETAPVRLAFAPSGLAKRVILNSFDGLGADALEQQPNLPSFQWLKNVGTTARIVTVNPTQTSPAHTSILTGAQPERHGVVANRFHVPGTPWSETVHGLATDISVETLLEAARRQGKRVGSIAFPTVDGRTPRRTADFGLFWSTPVTRPQTIKLSRKNFRSEWVPPGWTPRAQPHTSYSPVMRARVDCGGGLTPPADVLIAVYDTTDDQRENYDALIIESSGKEVPIDGRGWFALTRRAGADLQGSWSKIVNVESNLESATIYCGAFSNTVAHPEEFRKIVEEEGGFWPGEPDARAGVDIYREQIEHLSTFLTRVEIAAIKRMQFDLLLAYQPQIDESGHEYTITDASQKVYTPEVAESAASARRAAFEAADRAVGTITTSLDLTRDALVVVGDHGLVPVNTELRVNRLLAENGFSQHWKAFASGNVANIYRIEGNDDPAPLVALLRNSGWFELVRTKTAASHPNSGDVVAISYPNVILSPSADSPLTAQPRENGTHGALNSHRELHTVFFAVGAGVPRRDHPAIPQTKIARFVATLLGIGAPNAAE